MHTHHLLPINDLVEALVLYVIVVPVVLACIVTAIIFVTD